MDNEWVSADQYQGLPGYESAAGHSTVGHAPASRKGKCAAKNHTCRGFRTKDSIYCAGHKKAMAAK
jgi:hypothetical protein